MGRKPPVPTVLNFTTGAVPAGNAPAPPFPSVKPHQERLLEKLADHGCKRRANSAARVGLNRTLRLTFVLKAKVPKLAPPQSESVTLQLSDPFQKALTASASTKKTPDSSWDNG